MVITKFDVLYRFARINHQIHSIRFGAVRKFEIRAWVQKNM